MFDIRGQVQFTNSTRTIHRLLLDLLPIKQLCITKVSLQCDMHSKVQHMQRNMHLEVHHLMMLCIRGVNLLFLCYFMFEFIVVNPDVVLGQIC